MAITAPRVSSVTRGTATSLSAKVSELSAVAGETILIFACTRNYPDTPSATPPSGYSLYHDPGGTTPHFKVYAKIATGGDSDATVTFSGAGGTNACYAVALPGALQNVSTSKDAGGSRYEWGTNMNYPAVTPATTGAAILVMGAKIDMNWTSVAALANFTEILDNAASSVSVMLNYRLNAPALSAGNVAVTGDSEQSNFACSLSIKPQLPTLSAPTPSGTLGTQTTATIGATTDITTGTLYCVVDTGSLSGITAQNIKDGNMPGGSPAAFKAGNNAVTNTSPSVAITGLSAGTTYNYAAVHEDAGFSNIVTGSFTMAAPPATLSDVSITQTNTDGHVVSVTITGGNATVSLVALRHGAPAPSATQIAAGTDGADNPAEFAAAAGFTADVPGDFTITGLDWPTHDIYVTVSNDTASALDVFKLATSGYGYEIASLAGAPPAGSLFPNGAVTGDVLEVSNSVLPSSAGVNRYPDGTLSLMEVVVARQRGTYRVADISARDWFPVEGEPAGTFAEFTLNNQPPQKGAPIPAQTWVTGVAANDIRLEGIHVSEPEGDAITFTVTPPLPTGMSIAWDAIGRYHYITGTPASGTDAAATPYQIRATDEIGEYVDLDPFDVTILAGVTIPAIGGGLTWYTDGVDDIESAGLVFAGLSWVIDGAVDPGYIVESIPASGTVVPPGTAVSLVVSGVETPSVWRMLAANAISTLNGESLAYEIAYAHDSGVDNGYVAAQSPAPLAIVNPGATVNLIVSLGAELPAGAALVPSAAAGDIAITWDQFLSDVGLDGPDLATDRGLRTAVIVSLFSDARANADDPLPGANDDRRGWWGDAWPEIEGDRIGSRLWLLSREKQTTAALARVREYALEALQWLIDDGIARAIDVQAEWVAPGVLGVQVACIKPDGSELNFRFQHVWQATVN